MLVAASVFVVIKVVVEAFVVEGNTVVAGISLVV